MNIQKFTQKSIEALQNAQTLASTNQNVQGATGKLYWKKKTDMKTAAQDMTGAAVLLTDLL